MSKNFVRKQTTINNRQNKKQKSEQTFEFDSIDRKLMQLVADDSRLSYRELARRLNLSVGTVIERLKRLEGNQIIKNYSALIDPIKVGFPLTVVIEVIGEKGRFTPFDQYLSKLPNVCCVYSVTGRTDTVVIARFRNVDELNSFVRDMQKRRGVARTETLLVLDIYKEDFRPTII